MKQSKSVRWFVMAIALVCGAIVWWLWPSETRGSNPVEPALVDTHKRNVRETRETQILERVKVAAQRKLPGVNWDQGLDKHFAAVDPGIDELSVMEVLLEVETEFDIDLPEDAINLRVGEQHRRDLRGHLSLAVIADCVKESLEKKKAED